MGIPGVMDVRAFAVSGIVGLTTILTACGADEPTDVSLEAVVDTVDGVERLTYPESGAPRLLWTVDTTFVLGGLEAAVSEHQFGGLLRTSLVGTARGELYVLDADGRRVLGYGPDGAFLGSWGREGGGPGELGVAFGSGPTSIALAPGDTLWIFDRANQRFTLLPVPEGDAKSLPLPPSVQGIGGQMAIDGSGVAVVLTSPMSPNEPAPLVRLDFEGEPRDTFWTWVPSTPEVNSVTISLGGGRQATMLLVPVFLPQFSWVSFSHGGFAVQQSAEYEIQFIDANGRPERIVRRDPPSRPVTEEDRRRYLDSLLAPPERETPFTSEGARRQRADATTFAEVIPRIVATRRDTQDRLWVGVSEETPGTIERIDVYDAGGRLLGELRGVPMPDYFYGDGRAAIIDTDELDVQRIHGIRLREEGTR